MTGTRQLVFCLGIMVLAMKCSADSTPAAQPDISPVSVHQALPVMPPLPPPVYSPVTFFRQLLSMSPGERFRSLTNRTPEIRARILAKVHEYLLLSPDERELRLRATDLRWYLVPLFQLPPAERPARLARVPDDLQDLVKSRLAQWDALPPALQQEFLANEHTLRYFAQIQNTATSVTNAEQQQIAAQFEQFFELTPDEKQKALNTLSDAERNQMEKTLKSFEALPPRQRLLCVRNYARFAGMSPAERTDFLQNAEHWSQMSPQERQSWRDLVAQVPLWPPMPSMPPTPNSILPHPVPKTAKANMATN